MAMRTLAQNGSLHQRNKHKNKDKNLHVKLFINMVSKTVPGNPLMVGSILLFFPDLNFLHITLRVYVRVCVCLCATTNKYQLWG